MNQSYLRSGVGAAAARVLLYLALLMLPLIVAIVIQPTTDHPFWQEVSKGLALIGGAIVMLQPVIAARYRWVEYPFGLDALYIFHRFMGMVAGAFLVAHPILYALDGEWSLLFGFAHGWQIAVGKVGFAVLMVLVLSSLARRALSLEFETWRGVHNGLAICLLGICLVHGIGAGGDLGNGPLRYIWIGFFVLGMGSFLLHWANRGGKQFKVVRVTRETQDVTTLELAPIRPEHGIDHLPGQFLFLRLEGRGSPSEEHPFTIASSPSPSGAVAVTIKACGDFTSTVKNTQDGDLARINGPFGRFSYTLHQSERPLVFVAGGVGLTPILSMLRHLAATGTSRSILLLYGNRHEGDIVARDELDEMQARDGFDLRVVHVLSRATDDWVGDAGHINIACIQKHQPDNLPESVFYISGPSNMITNVSAQLCAAGVSQTAIHSERFAL